MRHRLLLSVAVLFLAASVDARIISYSPYTDRNSVPAHQHRMNRHFVLIEGIPPGPSISPVPGFGGFHGQAVVYDFRGEVEPRVVFPATGTSAFYAAAAREDAAGTLSILVLAASAGDNQMKYRLTRDGGLTWSVLDIPVGTLHYQLPADIDVGGPFVAARRSMIRIGDDAWPFLVATGNSLYAIGADGASRRVDAPDSVAAGRPIGRNAAGTEFLIVSSDGQLHRVRTATMTSEGVTTESAMYIDGWITPSGRVYVEDRTSSIRLSYVADNQRSTILEKPANALNLFAVPTFDFTGAWIIERGPGHPTVLHKHAPATGLIRQWEDITAPEVEALHAGSSGTKLLVQVHRPRPQADQRIFQDPALAIWNEGEVAPRHYDELYMDEQFNKGFVHLDVEAVAAGEPFVFDSGVRWIGGGGGGVSPSTPVGGGGDVIQEWGVVRASLKQRLVLPAVGRTPGAYGSYWVTDVILQNPVNAAQRVDIRFAPSGSPAATAGDLLRTITLGPNEIRLVEDVLHSLFGLESGTGAFFIEPESGIAMTSRTYSKSETGTYGFGMNAIDVYASAASARFPLTFAGAFLGQNYRTNMIITDAGESGANAELRVAGPSGLMGLVGTFDVGARGQQQINGVGGAVGLWPHETGGLLFRPTRGSASAAVFAIDNRTNDTTYFPPDLPAPIVRTIPAIGHIEGANNSRFRSDLYLYNPSAQLGTVTLQMKMWDSSDTQTINFTMLPNEARVITDVLQTMFGRTGIARLRYQSAGNAAIRVTSRTYSVTDEGGTYGFLMPPLNNFQSGGFGDTLEILGSVADDDYRTNIGLVDLAAFPSGTMTGVRVEIVNQIGDTVDAFTTNVPSAGGMQLNDIFRSRGLEMSGPVLIRISPLNGLVGAYATFIDNRTNDAVYLAANLGAKQ